MAPELIENSGTKTTFESDIYAFGITMWEIITGQEPYPDVLKNEDHNRMHLYRKRYKINEIMLV